jgi:hypothetical protein
VRAGGLAGRSRSAVGRASKRAGVLDAGLVSRVGAARSATPPADAPRSGVRPYVARRGGGVSPRDGARPPTPARGAVALGDAGRVLARGEAVGSALSRRGALARARGCSKSPVRGLSVRAPVARGPPVRGLSVRGPAVRGPAARGPAARGAPARGPAEGPREAGVRSKDLPAAGLAGQLLPAGAFPVAGLADRCEPVAGLLVREVSEVFPARVLPAADLPGQVLAAAGLPTREPLTGFAPAARAGRRSGDSGMGMRTFREIHFELQMR